MIWNAKNGTVSAGGSEMCYVSFGSGERTLILLPGLSDGLATVSGKALLLAPPYRLFFEKYTVYMFSRKNELPACTIRDMASDQAEAMKNLGIGKAFVMGVSQGGMIAQYLAVDHPEMVSGLVLAVTAPCANEVIRENVNRWLFYAGKGDHKGLMTDTAEKSYSDKYLKKYRKLYPLLGAVGKPSDYGRFINNANAVLQFDASADLQKISCPVLIIGGDDDKTVGTEAAGKLKELIPGSRMHIYHGLGHGLYEEAEDFNRRVYDFLETI
ncbi:MAG: alpha/beta hydrolase [Solobacterium sp.]|nr:alpha/beta hydrolase [Solobacterium sp.]